ncbi:hypothetical protein SAMN04515620_15115 [Collimonas sp. OK607]|uniref:hypothetical protein n=1 Tax=Collimonas sp. OK607 TaxID=1798194 RepID=UPI0008EC3B81|nr:hypothetical protein [Collimonas sp. OK607]SFB36186.1 hypothetical protein SAMN04515620_15115 [Collimonas sp. OK607]
MAAGQVAAVYARGEIGIVLVQQSEDLVPVLDGQVDIQRAFWLVAATETRNVARVAALWRYLREVIEPNRAFLMGESRQMIYPDTSDTITNA